MHRLLRMVSCPSFLHHADPAVLLKQWHSPLVTGRQHGGELAYEQVYQAWWTRFPHWREMDLFLLSLFFFLWKELGDSELSEIKANWQCPSVVTCTFFPADSPLSAVIGGTLPRCTAIDGLHST